jgi:hypothetical protein
MRSASGHDDDDDDDDDAAPFEALKSSRSPATAETE